MMSEVPHPETLRQQLREAGAELDAAEAAGDSARLCQALAQVSRCHRAIGALSEADWYARRGLSVARSLPTDESSVAALCDLAELSLLRADRLQASDEARGAQRLRNAARDLSFEAVRCALRAADAQWELAVLLRVSDVFDRLGDHDDAIVLQCRALGLIADAQGVALTAQD